MSAFVKGSTNWLINFIFMFFELSYEMLICLANIAGTQFYKQLNSFRFLQFYFSEMADKFSFCRCQSFYKMISGYSSIFIENILLHYVTFLTSEIYLVLLVYFGRHKFLNGFTNDWMDNKNLGDIDFIGVSS